MGIKLVIETEWEQLLLLHQGWWDKDGKFFGVTFLFDKYGDIETWTQKFGCGDAVQCAYYGEITGFSEESSGIRVAHFYNALFFDIDQGRFKMTFGKVDNILAITLTEKRITISLN